MLSIAAATAAKRDWALPDLLQDLPSAWLAPVLVALAAGAPATAAEFVAALVLLRLTRRYTVLGAVLRQTRPPVRLGLPLLALQTVWGLADDNLPLIHMARHITSLTLIAVLTWFAVRGIGAISGALVQLNPYDIEDNLNARRILTQTRVLSRSLKTLSALIGLSVALMTFPEVRHIGTSLLASAGLAGLVIGLAAKSVIGNLLAGLQLAITQPMRIDDVLIVQGQWGRVEEITGTYVVIHLWDERRLVVPLQWFIENPFENWTRTSANLLGSIYWSVDYRMPMAPLRQEMQRICEKAPEWDGRVCVLQVTDTTEKTMQLRGLVSSLDSGRNWDLRCRVREALIDYMQREFPEYLPLNRAEIGSLSDLSAAVGRLDGHPAAVPQPR
jgi:small-conductance mechanosensitive channel